MPTQYDEISTITAKGQTTIPKSIRRALGVDYGGQIAFHVDEAGVHVRRAEVEDNDPAIDSFLTFIARDLERRPEAIEALSPTLAARIADLTGGAEIDLDAPIEGEVDL